MARDLGWAGRCEFKINSNLREKKEVVNMEHEAEQRGQNRGPEDSPV